MNRRIQMVGIGITALLMTGCVQIPQAAIDVNRQVSSGIVTIGENGQEMISAWETSAYNMLDERWEKLYAKVNASYRKKRGIAAKTSLSEKQQQEVAGLAVLVRDEVRANIHKEAESMRKTLSDNTKNTLDANESITQLLISANSAVTSQQAALKEVGQLLPIPPVASKFVDDALQTAGD